MTIKAAEFREALKEIQLSQAELGRLVGVDPRSGRRWALGEREIPGCVELVLCLLRERPELMSVLKDIRAKRSAPAKPKKAA